MLTEPGVSPASKPAPATFQLLFPVWETVVSIVLVPAHPSFQPVSGLPVQPPQPSPVQAFSNPASTSIPLAYLSAPKLLAFLKSSTESKV